MMGKSGSLKMFACETISSRKLTQASVLACGAGGFFLFFSVLTSVHIGVRAGGRGGLQPPQILGNKRKFGQSQFLKTFPCFFIILKR